jgi:hypothetical protein
MQLKRALAGAVITGALALGTVVVGGTAAQAFTFCSTAVAGKTGVASCAVSGDVFHFQADVVCANPSTGQQREVLGAVTAPGAGSSSAACASTETFVSVHALILP